jgi:hypothetical protein
MISAMINETTDLQCWRCDQDIAVGEHFGVAESPEYPGEEFPTCLGCMIIFLTRRPGGEAS